MDLLDLLWVYEFQLDKLLWWLLEWEKLAVAAGSWNPIPTGKKLSFVLSVDDSGDAALSTIILRCTQSGSKDQWFRVSLRRRISG